MGQRVCLDWLGEVCIVCDAKRVLGQTLTLPCRGCNDIASITDTEQQSLLDDAWVVWDRGGCEA